MIIHLTIDLGNYLRKTRIECSGQSLREFCLTRHLDAVTYSKMERGFLVPDQDTLHKLDVDLVQVERLAKNRMAFDSEQLVSSQMPALLPKRIDQQTFKEFLKKSFLGKI